MPTLSHYQALLFDIDKTLTNSQRVITEETQVALNRFVDRGYLLGFCTGNHYARLEQKHLLQVLPTNSVHILTGGAQIVTNGGDILWEKLIPPEIVRAIIEAAQVQRVNLLAKHNHGFWGNDIALAEYGAQPDMKGYLQPLPANQPVGVHSLVISEPSSAFENFLASLKNVTLKKMLHYETLLIDITAANVNKGSTLEVWSDLTGIPLPEVIGFGDSANDVEFMQEVGWAVAMGNAVDEVKSLADRVIGHTDENGLATYLNQVVTTGEL